VTEAARPAQPASSLAPVLAAAAAAALTAFSPQIFNDGDTFMHVAAGARMLDQGAVLHADPFSFTFQGRPWQTHEWLSEVLMALAFRAAGWSGVALLSAAAVGATAGLMARHLGRWLSGPVLIGVLVLGLASLSSSLLARPHLLALPFLEMWAAEIVIAKSEGRLPSLWRLPLLMAVWANLHGSFLFGLALLGAFGLESVVAGRARPMLVLRWAGLGAVSALAAVASPHGIDNLLFPLRLTGMKTLSSIGEWSPMAPAAQPAFEIALLAGVFALVRTRARVSALSLLLLLMLTWMAFHQVRHVLLFGVIAPLLIAQPLGRALKLNRHPGNREAIIRDLQGLAASPGQSRAPAGMTAMGAVLALALATLRLIEPVRLNDSPVAPATALTRAPAAVRDEPVFSAYPFGGWLILNGVRPYIDSRAEVYGDAFRAQYAKMLAGDGALFVRELSDRRIGWTLLEPASPLAAVLDRTPGWRRLYADRFAVIHVRTGARQAPQVRPEVGPRTGSVSAVRPPGALQTREITPARSAPGPDRRPGGP
jgi:hypothetical protein